MLLVIVVAVVGPGGVARDVRLGAVDRLGRGFPHPERSSCAYGRLGPSACAVATTLGTAAVGTFHDGAAKERPCFLGGQSLLGGQRVVVHHGRKQRAVLRCGGLPDALPSALDDRQRGRLGGGRLFGLLRGGGSGRR